MQLILNTYGTLLRVKDGNFLVTTEDKKMELAPRKVRSILITTGVRLSSDVIKLALEWNIDLVFLDKFGDPYGRVWHCRLGSTTKIRRRQLEAAQTTEGLELVRQWAREKIATQIEHLEDLRKKRTRKSTELTDGIKMLSAGLTELEKVEGEITDALRNRLMGIEGAASRAYFTTLCIILPERYRFSGRSRNPARDWFNCLLNYSYGVLYSLVERGCILAGLDPYAGFLHTDNYNKKSLVFDFIEPYRAWGDRVVMRILSARDATQEHFNPIKGGFTLNKEGKALLLTRFNKYLEESVRYRGRNIKRRDIIQFDCHRLANLLLKNEPQDKIPEKVLF